MKLESFKRLHSWSSFPKSTCCWRCSCSSCSTGPSKKKDELQARSLQPRRFLPRKLQAGRQCLQKLWSVQKLQPRKHLLQIHLSRKRNNVRDVEVMKALFDMLANLEKKNRTSFNVLGLYLGKQKSILKEIIFSTLASKNSQR